MLLFSLTSNVVWSDDKLEGVMAYRSGDYTTALSKFNPLAEQGDKLSQFVLGTIYDKGLGVPQDYKTAVKWYRLSAEQGDANAQQNLGDMYEEGKGVIKDNIYAHMWANISASNGDEDAVRLRDFVEESMTPAEIAEAQKLARECVAKNYKDC